MQARLTAAALLPLNLSLRLTPAPALSLNPSPTLSLSPSPTLPKARLAAAAAADAKAGTARPALRQPGEHGRVVL